MKRILTCAMALLMLLSLTAPAFADIIWEPSDNSFYDDHRGACTYESRCYYANGKDGFVTLLDAPGGSTVREQRENGEVLWVGFTYGDKWALVNIRAHQEYISGWVPMSDLAVVYDYICFEEEYADKITDYNGEFADYNGDAKVINFYAYPGAAALDHSFEASNGWGGDILGNLTGTSEHPSCIRKIFIDEDGRTWGFISYLYGYKNGWFCLDEPDGRNFPVRDVPAANLIPAQEPVLPTASYVPYILVAAVVGATAGILVFFYGKKKKSTH